MFKKHLTPLLFVLALLLFAGCAKAPAAGDITLVQRGVEMALAMDELAGIPEYGDAMSASEELRSEIARMAAGNYGTPAAVYAIHLSDSAALALLGLDQAQLSEPLKAWLTARTYSSIPSLLVSHSGAAALAASSVMTYAQTFVMPEVTKPVVYLYRYSGDYDVMVVFTPGSGGAVSGAASFMQNSGELAACTSAEEVDAWLGECLPFEVNVSTVSDR